MPICNRELVEFLKSKNVKNLYHANSVSTWMTFIASDSLLSRRYVKKNGLWQTYQPSDKTDEAYDIEDDIFLDIMDLHNTFKRKNSYGPVVGVFSIDAIESDSFDIEITCDNPIYWTDSVEYFASLNDYIKAFESANSAQLAKMMLTIRKPQNGFPLDFLEYLVLDNPYISLETSGKKYDLFGMGKDYLESALNRNSRNIPVKSRNCSCDCASEYQKDSKRAAFMFIDQNGIRNCFHKQFS